MTEFEEQEFSSMLGEDVRLAMARRAESDTQSSRRDLVRTIWAANDGLIWVLREHVTDCAEMTYGLEEDERMALSETTYHVTDQGQIRPHAKFVPLLAMFRLIARISRRVESKAQIDFGGRGWDHLCESQKIRNRITHPKSREDLFLSDEDVQKTELGFFWLLSQVVDSMAQLNQATKDYIGQFDDVLETLKSGDPEVTRLYEQMVNEESVSGAA